MHGSGERGRQGARVWEGLGLDVRGESQRRRIFFFSSIFSKPDDGDIYTGGRESWLLIQYAGIHRYTLW